MDKHGFFQALRINKQRKLHNIMDSMSFKLNGTNQLDLKLKHRKLFKIIIYENIVSSFEITTEYDSSTFSLYCHNKFTDKKDLIKRLEFCSLK